MLLSLRFRIWLESHELARLFLRTAALLCLLRIAVLGNRALGINRWVHDTPNLVVRFVLTKERFPMFDTLQDMRQRSVRVTTAPGRSRTHLELTLV